jgi:hypothetical protein
VFILLCSCEEENQRFIGYIETNAKTTVIYDKPYPEQYLPTTTIPVILIDGAIIQAEIPYNKFPGKTIIEERNRYLREGYKKFQVFGEYIKGTPVIHEALLYQAGDYIGNGKFERI